MKCSILVGTDNVISVISSLETETKFRLNLLDDLIKVGNSEMVLY